MLQLYAIASHRCKVWSKSVSTVTRLFNGLAVQEAEHFANDVVQVERRFLKGGPLEEGPDAPDHLAGFLAVAHDSFRGLVCLAQVGRLGRKPAQTGVAIRHYRRERLVDLVRDGSGEFAHGRNLRGARKSCLGAAQSFLHILPIVDIDQQAVPASAPALGIAQQVDRAT